MSFADTMVAKFEALLQSCAGLRSINVDGNNVTYADLERQYSFWLSRQARANGSRPRAAQVNLTGRGIF